MLRWELGGRELYILQMEYTIRIQSGKLLRIEDLNIDFH
jgi:hypothetical protein